MRYIDRCIIPSVLKIKSSKTKIHYYSFAEDISAEIFRCNQYNIMIEFYTKPSSYFKQLSTGSNKEYFSKEIVIENNENGLSLLWRKKIYPVGTIYSHLKIFNNRVLLEVNNFYYSIIKFKIENLIPPGLVLRDLTYLTLISNNYLPLHSSAFAIDEKKAFLILAPPNVGKSYTVMKAGEAGFRILSEDISLVNLYGTVFPVLYTSTYIHEVTKLRYLSLLSYYIPYRVKPIIDKSYDTLQRSSIYKIFILEHSRKNSVIYLKKGNQFNINKKDIVAKILALNRDEFKIYSNKLITAYFYITNSLLKFNELEVRLIHNLIDNVKDIVLIKAVSVYDFFKEIQNLIE